MRTLRFAGVFGLASVLGLMSCSDAGGGGGSAGAGNGQSGGGSAGLGGGAGLGGVGNAAGISGTAGIGAGINVGDAGGGDCQVEQIRFDPKIPTVFMLVDRSGSMFEVQSGTTTTAWQTLRTGALSVIQNLEAEVRFGFGAYAAFGGMCPDMPTIAPDFNNYAAISGLYNTLEKPEGKIDTGSSFALSRAADLLWADTTEGEKYILFVTDGEPDYCDDGNSACPVDSVVGTIQRLYAGRDTAGGTHPPIGTIVFGIGTTLTTIGEQALAAFANAGAGQPPAPILAPPAQYDQCQGVAPWMTDFNATGKGTDTIENREQAVGDYGAGGTATPFKPNPADQEALTGQIASALAGVKACTFDLGNNLKVDLNQLNRAEIVVCKNLPAGAACTAELGTVVPLSETDGWRMNSATQLELVGTACQDWRTREANGIKFGFPCEIIIAE